MAIISDEKLYEGNAIVGIRLNLIYFRATTGGTIKNIYLWVNSVGPASWYFNVRVAGVPLWSGVNRLLINAGQLSTSKLNVNAAVAKGDIVQLDLEQAGLGQLTGPVVFLVEYESNTVLPAEEVTFTTSSLADDATGNGTVDIAKGFILKRVEAEAEMRLRLYKTAAARTADASRPFGDTSYYGTEHGIICDLQLANPADLDWMMSPEALGGSGDDPTTKTIYYAVQNLSGVTQALDVTFHFVKYEV